MDISDKKLEELLSGANLLTTGQLARAAEHQRQHGGLLKDSVVSLGLLDEETIVSVALAQTDISYIRLKNYPIHPEVTRLVPREKCLAYTAIPISLDQDLLTVAVNDPFNVLCLDDLHILTQKEVLPVYARKEEILAAIDKHYPYDRMSMTDVVEKLDTQVADSGTESILADLQRTRAEDNERSPVMVMLANKIIEDAYHQGASDIHIEHLEGETQVRYRIDGLLRKVLPLPPKVRQSLTARVKIMSNLDISEKRLPQDGRIVYKLFSKSKLDIDIRVSTMPTAWGEKVVMRLLDKQKEAASLDRMAFLPDTLERYRALIQRPWGMILHVGPTGSGKTTTLYAALAEINTPDTNIQTAEDPIEYLIPRINQTQVHPEIDFTFARALRGFLRQDPDVIMVGEIRDLETAKIATEASLTGHLLFSTLHTNDSAQTVSRLIEMGVQPFLISATLLGVCAQRLVRCLCQCKQRYEPTPEDLKLLGLDPAVPFLHRARGCGVCHNSGYKGRLGIQELMVVTDELRHAINEQKPAIRLKEMAVAGGMRTLQQDAAQKVLSGITSLEEVVRGVSGVE